MDKKIIFALCAALLLGAAAPLSAGETEDEYDIFREAAEFITASLRATARHKAPASVSVLTAEVIKASGASTLWDALRLVPGVDVAETRTGQGDVSIRGFNQSDSNRVLVLLDGRTVLQEFFGITVWDEIPVGLEEIDRIEVVRGPASALYGANAIHGVINIVTRSANSFNGAVASAGAGNRETRRGSVLYGHDYGRTFFKAGADYGSMNRFGDGSLLASRVAKAHAAAAYRPGSGGELGLSGSLSRVDDQLGLYNNGLGRPLADGGSLRADWRRGGFKARTFWTTKKAHVRDFWGGPDLKYDTYDASVDQELRPAESDRLVVGAGYRRNSITSDIFPPGTHNQDLYALFVENTWEPSGKWAVVAGARLDHHSLAGYAFSPRGSVSYFPDENNTLRVSAGTSFRNPTLVENYVSNTQTSAFSDPSYPGVTALAVTYTGGRGLDPESMRSVEAGWDGVFGRLRAGLSVYAYLLTGLINTGTPDASLSGATLNLSSTWANTGRARGAGGEAFSEYAFRGKTRVFGNYSYFHASEDGRHNDSHNSPGHKLNAGLRWTGAPLSGMLWANLAGPTWWDDNLTGASPRLRRVAGYMLVSAGAVYGFGGGPELRLKAYNLLDNRHYEVLPYRGPSDVGQYGEIVGARYLAELAWRF